MMNTANVSTINLKVSLMLSYLLNPDGIPCKPEIEKQNADDFQSNLIL